VQNIIIDREFQFLLPKLGEQAYTNLEEDILENGIRDRLVLWGDILIDGYNRFSIAQKHNLSFETLSMEFNSREEVKIWMIKNQIERRNLTPYQLRYFRGLHYQTERKLVTNKTGINQHSEVDCQNEHQPQTVATSRIIAEIYDVSQSTIMRDSKLADALIAIGEVSPEAKQSILSGDTKITRNELDAMMSGSANDIVEIAESIDNGTFTEHKENTRNSETRTLDTAFSHIASIMKRELQSLSKNHNTRQVKTALKQHIKALEDMYNSM
jgi:hypothetical protein